MRQFFSIIMCDAGNFNQIKITISILNEVDSAAFSFWTSAALKQALLLSPSTNGNAAIWDAEERKPAGREKTATRHWCSVKPQSSTFQTVVKIDGTPPFQQHEKKSCKMRSEKMKMNAEEYPANWSNNYHHSKLKNPTLLETVVSRYRKDNERKNNKVYTVFYTTNLDN